MDRLAGLHEAPDFRTTRGPVTRAHASWTLHSMRRKHSDSELPQRDESSWSRPEQHTPAAFAEAPVSSPHTLKGPKPAHNLTTSPELLRRRQEQQAAAQALTTSLFSCRTLSDAKALYECYGEQFNAIHFAALFTALGRLGTATCHAADPYHPTPGFSTTASSAPASLVSTAAAPTSSTPPISGPTSFVQQQRPTHPSFHQRSPSGTSSGIFLHTPPPSAPRPPDTLTNPFPGTPQATSDSASRSATNNSVNLLELRAFLSQQLLPHVELRLMGFGTRQLAAVLAALAQMECPPPAFWMSEWLQHFVRRLEAQSASQPDKESAEARHAPNDAATTAAAAAAVDEATTTASPSNYTTSDIARVMWALAQLQKTLRGATPALHATHAGASHHTVTSITQATASATSLTTSVGGASSAATTLKQRESAAWAADGPAHFAPHDTNSVLRDGPSLGWYETVSRAFAAQASVATAADVTSFLSSAARLGYRPPASVMTSLIGRCALLMDGVHGNDHHRWGHRHRVGALHTSAAAGTSAHYRMGPRQLTEVLWALAVLGFRPEVDLLRKVGKELERLAMFPTRKAVVASLPTTAELLLTAPVPSVKAGLSQVDVVDQLAPENGKLGLTEESDWWCSHFRLSSGSSVVRNFSALSGRGDALAGNDDDDDGSYIESRQAATCLWAFLRMGFHPSKRVVTALLRRACTPAAVARAKGVGTAAASAVVEVAAPQDLSMAAYALGVLRFQPEPDEAMVMLKGMESRLPDASAQDLVIWVTALARMRLAVPDSWVAGYIRRSARELKTLAPLALVNWLDAVSRLRTARPPRRSRLEQELVVAAQQAQKAQHAQQACELQLAALGYRGTNVDTTGWHCAEAAVPAVTENLEGRTHGAAADIHINDVGDPWVVVALPKAKLPLSNASRTSSQRQQHHRRRFRQPLRRSHGDVGQAISYPRSSPSTPLPLAPSRHLQIDAARPPFLSKASEEEAAAATGVMAQPPFPVASCGETHPIFIRPAARHLQRQLLLPRVLRLTAARLPQLDLEQHCRLAWAVAHLNAPVRRDWVDALLEATAKALERRLRPPPCTLQERLKQPHTHVPGAAPGLKLATGLETETRTGVVALEEEEEEDAASPVNVQMPVVDARWLLKLVRAVDLMIRGPSRSGDSRRRQRRLELAHRRRDVGREGTTTSCAQPQAVAGAGEMQRSEFVSLMYTYVPRRWRVLIMMAMQPQLSALTNVQLLRFVRALARLRGGPGSVAAARSSDKSVGGENEVGSAAGNLIGGWGRHGPYRRVAAELGRYCRRRLEATCGAEEACDLVTMELMRWTQGWERREGSEDSRVERVGCRT